MKSHRVESEVPDGTNYEAMEGARAGSAVREANCQVLSNCGGAAVSIPTLTSAGREFGSVKTGSDVITNKSGEGCESGACWAVYSERSTAQQPESAQCEFGLPEAGLGD